MLDGILRAGEPGEAASPLGRYDRPGGNPSDRFEWARILGAGEKGSRYRSYLSQYGLQGRAWSALHHGTGASIGTMHPINTGLLALVVAILFVQLRALFGAVRALGFSAVLVFSPWVVVFSPDLYRVVWTWFLPLVAGMALADRAGSSRWTLLGLAAAIYATVLLKALCGYEYLSTIVAAVGVPVVYHGVARRLPWLRIVGVLAAVAVAGTLAVGTTIAMHQRSMSTQPDGPGGDLTTLIEKRLYSTDPRATAEAACEQEFFGSGPVCVDLYERSLRANPLRVVATYFVFGDLLPWLPRLEHRPSDAFKAQAKAAVASRSPGEVLAVMRGAGWPDLSRYVVRAVDTLVFLALLAALTVRLVRLRHARPELAWSAALALLAPISWFVLAKGHSYIHTGLNYVVWYLPFVPFALAVLLLPREAR